MGGSIASTRWDWPEWACMKSSPEEYMLKSLASRNSGTGKVGLLGGYGKSLDLQTTQIIPVICTLRVDEALMLTSK